MRGLLGVALAAILLSGCAAAPDRDRYIMIGSGAAIGAGVGAIIGHAAGGPPGGWAGAAIGAASGAIGGALTDLGIDDKFMKETAEAIQPGHAALFVLIRSMTADKVLEALRGEGGVVMRTSLDHTKEEALRTALAGATAAAAAPPAAS